MPRRRIATVTVVAAALVVAAFVLVTRRPGDPWVEAGSVEMIDAAGVTYIPDANAFVVSGDPSPVALAGWSTHMGPSEPILFCETAEAFFSPAHGEKWDRQGLYTDGPAPRGLDRFPVQIVGGTVYVDPSTVVTGPARGSQRHHEIHPPFCDEGYREIEPGIVEPLER